MTQRKRKIYFLFIYSFKKEVLSNPDKRNKNLLLDYFNSFFSSYSEKFKDKNYNEFCKEILDSLSIKDIINDEEIVNEKEKDIKKKNELINKNEPITPEEKEEKESNEDYDIFAEIKEFISFDKSKNTNNTINENAKKNNNLNYNNYLEPIKYVNDIKNYNRNKYDHFTNNVKTIKGCSPDRYSDIFDPPYLVKNEYDHFDYNNNFRNNFIRNNIYKNQQFQDNQIFNFRKQYEVNSFLLEPQCYPSLPPYYLQKTVPFPYNNQAQMFSCDNNNSFCHKIPDKFNQFNYYPLTNNSPLLKTIQNNNNNFLNTFNFSSNFVNKQIKAEGKFIQENLESNNNNTSKVAQEKKPKKKLKKKLFIKNNKLVYVINEKHTDTKDAIYLDEDSENNKDGKNKKNNKLDIIKEKLAEERKPRSSKYRGVSKNGKHWQVLIMIKQKKRYIGNFSDEEEAAREYDKIAIQFHGPKAKTNFQYNEDEINSILASPKLKKLSYLF